MGDRVELRDLRGAMRQLWWIPLLLALMGVGAGALAQLAGTPVYRAQGTVLVGQVDGTVLRSTSLRASESLAVFYADMARRQIVLEPVARTLGLPDSWHTLRNDVSAVALERNPRLIAISVLRPSRSDAERIAEQLMRQLVSLSPHPVGGTEQEFVSNQMRRLKLTIEQSEALIQRLNRQLAQTTTPLAVAELRRQITENQKLLNDWRQGYVDLTALDPGSDAGGLQVIDEVTTARSSNSAGIVGYGALGGSLAAVLGLVFSWLLSRRYSSPPAEAAPDPADTDQALPTAEPLDTGGNGWTMARPGPAAGSERAPVTVRG